MTQEILTTVKEALENSNIYSLFEKAIGSPEEESGGGNAQSYALMFNLNTQELFFLEYATSNNSWAKTAESQNPWLCVGYMSACDVIVGDTTGISDELDFRFEQEEMWKNEVEEREELTNDDLYSHRLEQE